MASEAKSDLEDYPALLDRARRAALAVAREPRVPFTDPEILHLAGADPDRRPSVAGAAALQRLHRAMRDFPGELPVLTSPLVEVPSPARPDRAPGAIWKRPVSPCRPLAEGREAALAADGAGAPTLEELAPRPAGLRKAGTWDDPCIS